MPLETYEVTAPSILLEANALVHGERQADYKHPLDDFTTTAEFWTSWLRGRGLLDGFKRIDAADVGPMMTLLKLSRESRKHKRDNLVDGAGYLETTQMVLDEREKRAGMDTCAPAPGGHAKHGMTYSIAGGHGHVHTAPGRARVV